MFFDYYVFSEGSLQNGVKVGELTGFSLKTRISYYRGVPLSMIAGIELVVDGGRVDPLLIHFNPNNGKNWFTLKEMATKAEIKWEFGEEAIIFVEKMGGLPAGTHTVTLRTTITVAYAPINFMGECTRTVAI